jgi:hypothetical protein
MLKNVTFFIYFQVNILRRMRKFYTWLTLIFLSSISVLQAQVAVTTPNQTYNQDFNTLDTSGSNQPFNIEGWEINLANLRASNGFATNGDVYSFGSTGDTERALGGITSGSVSRIYFGVSFENTSGEDLNEFNVQYKGEQWRRGNKTSSTSGDPIPDTLMLEYSMNATSLIDAAATWKKASYLDFISPIADDSVRALNGNLAENSASISGKFNANFDQGSTIYVRWAYIRSTVGVSGSRDGLAVDDFSITFKNDSTWVDSTDVSCDYDFDAYAYIYDIENTTTSVSIEFDLIEGASGYLITLDEVGEEHEFGYPTDGESYTIGEFIDDTKVIGLTTVGTFSYDELNVDNFYYITVTPFYECEGSIFYGTEDFIDFITEEVLPPCEDPLSYYSEYIDITPSATSAEFTFAPVEEAVGYIVLLDTDYDNDEYAWGEPSDGESYIAGDYIDDTKVVYVGSETTITINDLISNTTYFLSVNPIFSCDASNVYGDWNGDEFNTKIEGCEFDVEATATITDFTNDTASFSLVFDTIAEASSYLIVLDYLQSDEHEFGYPTDKTEYNVGDFIEDSEIIGIITENQFDYSGLVINSEYYITIFPIYNCSDTSYYGAESYEYFITNEPATPCTDATAFAVESVSVVPSETTAEFSFTPLADAIGYIVFLDTDFEDEGYDWGWPEDGSTYAAGEYIGASKVVYVGTETTITVSDLLPSTVYILAVFPIFDCEDVNTYGDFNSEEFMTTTVTSIKQTISNNMLIYPNPISGNELNIKLNNSIQGKATVQIFNVVGSEVYSSERTISSNMQLTLPNQLAAGRYTIRIEQDGEYIIGSFAIVR